MPQNNKKLIKDHIEDLVKQMAQLKEKVNSKSLFFQDSSKKSKIQNHFDMILNAAYPFIRYILFAVSSYIV